MTYRRWDVVVVPYPFIEGLEAKRRPALIVSNDAFHQTHGLYWMAMITTAKAGTRPDDIPVTMPEAVGLPEDCVIRPVRLATLSDTLILRRVGTIKTRDRVAVTALIKRYVG